MVMYAYFFVTIPITNEGLESLDKSHKIICWPSMILQLENDIGSPSVYLLLNSLRVCPTVSSKPGSINMY